MNANARVERGAPHLYFRATLQWLAQLASQWSRSTNFRDRYLASLLAAPAPANALAASVPARDAAASASLVANDPAAKSSRFTLFYSPFTKPQPFPRALDAAPSRPPVADESHRGFREYDLVTFRVPRSEAEVRLSIVNFNDPQFRLNPANIRSEESRERTAAVSARFRF